MKKHWYYFAAAILATLFTTSAQAEEVSRKAADLIAKSPLVPTNKQSDSSNFVAQNSDANSIDSQLPASNYWYVSGSAGGAFPNDLKAENPGLFIIKLNLDSAFQWSIAGGYQWKDARAELEVSNSSFGVNKLSLNDLSNPATGNINATTLLVNGYYDIPTGSKFRPYIGAGIGVGLISGKIMVQNTAEDLVGSGSSFAYQGKVGLQYEVAKKGNAFVEFKYLGISSYKNDIGSDISLPNSYGVSVGYRQGF